MGRGFYANFSFVDLRPKATSFKLKKINSYGDWMDPFNPPDSVQNNSSSDFIYFEFDNGYNASGDAEYAIVDEKGNQLAYLAFKFRQHYKCCKDNVYDTAVQFRCTSQDYVLIWGKNVYTPKDYPSSAYTTIDNMPYDSEKINIIVAYKDNAPIDVNNFCWLAAHNAYANEAEGWLYYQQTSSFEDQMKKGVRAFALDAWLDSGQEDKVVLAHGGVTGKYKLIKLGKFDTLKSYLDKIRNFLIENPRETIFIFIEDNVKTGDSIKAVFSGYLDILYGQEIGGQWECPNLKTARLPELSGKIVAFGDVSSAWLPYAYDQNYKYIIETVYGDKSISKDFSVSCRQRDESRATDQTAKDYALLVVNQFPDFLPAISLRLSAVVASSAILAGLALFTPALGLVGGVVFLAGLIMEIYYRNRINAINNAKTLMAKIDWLNSTVDVANGKYGKVPNFIFLDNVLSGSAIQAIGYADKLAMTNYIQEHAELNPSTILLGEYLLADQQEVSAYLLKDDGKSAPLAINTNDKLLYLQQLDSGYEVHLLYGAEKNDIHIGNVAFTEYEITKAWYFEYKRKYIDYEVYLSDGSDVTQLRAYINGLFTRWIDVESEEIRTSKEPQLVNSKLKIISTLGGIDLNFIDIKGVEGVEYYKIFIQCAEEEPVICATCYNNMQGLLSVPVAPSKQSGLKSRSHRKSEVPPGYYLQNAPKSMVDKFFHLLKEAGPKKACRYHHLVRYLHLVLKMVCRFLWQLMFTLGEIKIMKEYVHWNIE